MDLKGLRLLNKKLFFDDDIDKNDSSHWSNTKYV